MAAVTSNALFLFQSFTVVLLMNSVCVHCDVCDSNNSGDECNKLGETTLSSLMQAIGRSVTTSSVVTVNLKNAAILAALKAIVIVAGLLGKLSFWTFPKLGSVRKLQDLDNNVVDEITMPFMAGEDIRWASTYMWSLNKKNFGCFYRLACENPSSAVVYSQAAVILRDIASFFGFFKHKKFYEKLMSNVDLAATAGFKSRSHCKVYACYSPFKRRFV